MAATLRELRERRNSVSTTMKITRAMEMIAASRVTRAERKAVGAEEYTLELRRAVSAVAAFSDTDHPLNSEHKQRNRSALLVISSDRGLAGGYPSNINKAAEKILGRLNVEGIETDIYTCGRKAREYFEYREVELAGSWEGFSEDPRYEHAEQIGELLMKRFLDGSAKDGIDEVHIVYTQFKSLVSQQTRIVRLLPLLIVDADDEDDTFDELLQSQRIGTGDDAKGIVPEYSFEPDAETVLDALTPMYIIDTIKFMLRESAASELASRQQAMHSATDNAKQLINDLTRQANQARQGEITQEITEIVSGADALSDGQEN